MKIKDVEWDESKLHELAEKIVDDLIEGDVVCAKPPCPINPKETILDLGTCPPDDADFFPKIDSLTDFLDKNKKRLSENTFDKAFNIISIVVTLVAICIMCYCCKLDATPCLFIVVSILCVTTSAVALYVYFKYSREHRKCLLRYEEKEQAFAYKMYEESFRLKNIKYKVWQQCQEESLSVSHRHENMDMDEKQQKISYLRDLKKKEMEFLNAYLKHYDNIVKEVGEVLKSEKKR